MMTVATAQGSSDELREPVLVRIAGADDLPGLLRLYRQLSEDPAAVPADPIKARSVMETIAEQPGRQVLVAEADGKIVGTADLLIVPNLTHGGAPWAAIENVVVDEVARRHGVGHALVAELVRRCTEAGCYKMQLLSNKRRTEAHEFYRSEGFEAVAEGFRRYLLV
jgi:GNAT superfamily N-acetyltransferase